MDISFLQSFFLDKVYLEILGMTLTLFLAMFVLWFAYMQLSKRDLFTIKKLEGKHPGGWAKFVYGLKYLFVFPFLTFFWFLLFIFCLRLLSNADAGAIMFLGIVLVSAIRIAAYANEHMAEDLAKMMPLALLATVIMDPSFSSLHLDLGQFRILTTEFVRFAKYLVFIIVLEFILRIGHGLFSRARKES